MSVNEFGLEELLCLPCLISCINSKPPTFDISQSLKQLMVISQITFVNLDEV